MERSVKFEEYQILEDELRREACEKERLMDNYEKARQSLNRLSDEVKILIITDFFMIE